MRIMEFPRYASFAQSFANTVPFSESMGFVMDIQKDDPDIPFYVTAHELGHQWWGHQVIEANVKGNGMLSESLSEYSALMVLKNHVSTEVMQKFMKYNLDEYLYGRATERKKEQPLYLCENQQYIHYNKGSVCLYALQDYIGEEKVNQALSEYAKDWKYAGPDNPKKRYPTTLDLLSYLKKATPDSLKYLITDLFETITLYENKTDIATAKKLKNNTYEITLKISTEKSRADKSGNQKVIGMNDWIDVGVYGKDAEGNDKLIYLKKHRFNKKDKHSNLQSKKSLSRLV
jgi:aminopeptidase N